MGSPADLPEGWEYVGELFDDIPVPPPREAGDWYCAECGQPGGVPDAGFAQMDRRFAVGMHDCARGGKRVALVADYAFNRKRWEQVDLLKRMKKAYESEQRGTKLKPDQAELAARYRARIGIVTNREAGGGRR